MSYGDSKIGTPWRGYYITAYGIAVKHGFKGTEEEWLASLQGVDGRSIEIRYNDVTNVLEWKFTDDDAWTQLLDLEQLQTEIVAQTLAQAQAAQQAAEAAQAAAEAAQKEAEKNAGVTQADASITQTNVQLSQDAKTAAQAAQAAAETAQQASEVAQAAAETAETGAEESATLSKSWAVGGTGTRPGEDTNNAEYWAGQAAAAAGGGVVSFNGRTGTVLPELGDYNPRLVGSKPNRNLWDNGYFAGGGSQKGYGIFPVNQRGQNKYDQADGNCIDRNYKSSNAVVELLQDCIKVTLKANEAPNRFAHRIFEALVEGETYTISILTKSVSSEINVFVQESGGEFTTPVLETFSGEGMFSATFVCTKSAQYQVIISNESKIEIEVEIIAGKLEIGEKQTLAYQKDGKWILFETPDFRETLARCQRCLYIAALSTLSTYYYASVVPTSGDIFFPVIVPETMRAVPVISAAQATLYVGDATKTVTGITCYALRGNQALCRANGVATTASVKTGIVEIGGLQLSAEL